MSARDIDALLDCFAEDYRSDQPAHPDRAFGGREQVGENWSAILAGVRDGRVAWARLYVEPVEEAGGGIRAAVRRMSGEEAGR
jgi:hypothetical protein